MSLVFKSLSGLETIAAGQLANNQRITLITAQGLVNATWGTLSSAISGPLNLRLDELEEAIAGSTGPSIWPAARTISLTGAVTGSVAMDGSANVSLATSIADGSLAQAKVNGLVTKLDELGTATNNRWGTGYTIGAYATSYGGNLNSLAGATFLFTQTGVTNVPDPVSNGQFVILQNGPQNFGQQFALRNGEAWLRGQNLGTWSDWRKLWTSANLDPSTLLLKTDVATAATKLANSRTFSLTGLVTASNVAFDGTGNVALATSIADNALTIAKVNGLGTALASKIQQYGSLLNVSLNTAGITGVYGQSVDAYATTANNYPVVGAVGVLNVTNQEGLIEQEYITSSNQHYRRIYNGSSWTTWARIWGSGDFDPTTKYDKSGGAINGNANVVGTFGASEAITGKNYVATLAYTNSRIFGLALPRPTGMSSGVVYGSDYIGLATTVNNPLANHELKITDAGALLFKDQPVYHANNFDPANPVPTAGLLNIGDPGSSNLRLRKDGSYSIDGGSTWAQFGGVQDGTDPRFNTVSIGADTDIRFYEDMAGRLALRTGSSSAYKYFTFGANGDFALDGRVFVNATSEVWHAGNFNPTTKLGTTATAAAATKLATARTINGIAFDGTANITIPSNVNPDDFVKVVQTVGSYSTADALNGKLAYAVAGSTALGTPLPYMTTWNFGDNGSRDGQFSWTYSNERRLYFRSRVDTSGGSWKAWDEVWTANTFNPATKANLAGPTFTSIVYFDVDNGSTAKARFLPFGANGINLDAVTDDASAFAPLNLRGTTVTINSATPWTSSNFTPGDKLDARGALGTSANTHTDWNTATNNGWWMASNAANAPGGLADWFIGTVTVHNGDWIQQEVERFTEGGLIAGAKYRRWKKSGTWGAWTQDLIVGGALSANRMASGWDSGNAGSISCSNWFRTTGPTGIYFSDYGGGVYMQDTTYVRTYQNKAMAASWFETTGSHNPQVSANAAGFRTSGNYGGGYGMTDGNYHITMYSESGHLCFGFGVNGVAKKAQVNSDGTYYGTDFAINSDETLKTEITPFKYNGPLAPVNFQWIADGKWDFGFIAQQVQEKYPEAVEVDPHTGTLRLKQAKLTAVLAAQANTHGEQIAALQRDVAELKALVAELRNR